MIDPQTVCYVKPRSGTHPKGLCRAFVAFFTGRAPIIQGRTLPEAKEFLRVEYRQGEAYPETVAICSLFDGVTTSYKLGKCKTVSLRNLRSRFVGGEPEHCLWCARCGAVRRIAEAQLLEDRPSMCQTCKAGLSDRACPMFHAFGMCERCEGVPLGDVPFEPQTLILNADFE